MRIAVRWVVVTVVAIIGAGVAALKALGLDWPWLLLIMAVVGAVLALPAKITADRIQEAAKRRHALRGARRRVREYTDPTELGVHRALLPEVPGSVPVYVPRDRDEDIVKSLSPGTFLLVLGDSGAGKTRAAFEALAATLPAHRLIVPHRTALATAVEEMADLREAILWLDDLENYLGTNGLTTTMISQLLSGEGHHRVIVATLRTQELKRMEEDDEDRQLGEDRRKVLARAHQTRLEKQFTEPELDRARNRSHDPRIAEALPHTDQYGLAEYLAAGPQLLQRWQNGWSPRTNPRGAALVQAAVDLRRAGYLGPLPRALLNVIHEHYLAARGPRLYPEPLGEAWAWARKPWRDTTALLEESELGASTVVDYVVDHVQRASSAGDHVPVPIIEAAFQHADITDLINLAAQASSDGRYPLAHQGFALAVEQQTRTLGAEHPNTLNSRHLQAVVLSHLGKLEEADAEHRAVLQVREQLLGAEHPDTLASRGNVAMLLGMQGRLEEAAADLRAVLQVDERVLGDESPNTLADRNNLAMVLLKQGKLEEAAAEHRAVLQIEERVLGAEAPSTLISRGNIANVLSAQGKLEEALGEHEAVLEVRTRVLGAEHPDTLASRNNLALVLAKQGRTEAAAAEYRAVLQVLERVLGAEHPDTLIIRNNLSVVLQGDSSADGGQ